LDNGKPSSTNFYVQLLRACTLATTPFIAIAEDDSLYNEEHFALRPPLDVFGYNMHRWSTATWGEQLYSMRNSMVGASCIAPRLEMIDSLQDKVALIPKDAPSDWQFKIGECGVGGEKALGVKERKSMKFYTKNPIIQVNHDYFTNAESTPEGIARRHRKSFGIVRAYDIPYWGHVSNILSNFK